MRNDATPKPDKADPTIRVWDPPTRVFHWALVILVVVSVITGNVGGLDEMELHKLSGYAILALVLFRMVWGVIGSPRSRFADFVRGPRAVFAYAVGLMRPGYRGTLGHNPLGGWSVMALLALLLVQAGTGLFANDDIFTEGPLAGKVSKSTSDWLTEIHELNSTLLLILIGVHVSAVLFYLLVKRENLIRPMFTGRKAADAEHAPSADAPFAHPLRAAVILAAAAAVWLLVR